MSKTIMMPIVCVGELCASCPELEISTETTHFYSDANQVYSNIIYCTKYRKCEQLVRYLERDIKKEDNTNESGNS